MFLEEEGVQEGTSVLGLSKPQCLAVSMQVQGGL